jgi:hypothetical protein
VKNSELWTKAICFLAAEDLFRAVILSEAKDLALCFFNAMRDSLSPAAPQNDDSNGFFRSWLGTEFIIQIIIQN